MIGERLWWRVGQIGTGVVCIHSIHSFIQRVREWDRYALVQPVSFSAHNLLFCRSITSVTNSQYSIYGHSTTKLKKGLLKPLETPLFEFAEAEVSSRLRVVSVKSRGCVPDSCAATSKVHKMLSHLWWVHWLLSSREKLQVYNTASCTFLGTLACPPFHHFIISWLSSPHLSVWNSWVESMLE